MTEITKFIPYFHSIQGDTLREKQKNFNEFQKTLKFTNEDDLNNFMQLIIPKTVTEEIFKINLMIKFKRNKLLFEELRVCNPLVVAKLLKDWRTFGELFADVTTNDLVNNILPHFSYSSRLKLLNGICKNVVNEAKLDDYFFALQKKYGLRTARIILPGCSLELITSKIKQYHLKLPEAHLKKIFKRDKQFVDIYFGVMREKYEDIKFDYEYSSALKYIAKIDPHTYWHLEKKYQFKIKFGKYMTPKMIKSNQNISNEGFDAFEKFHSLKMFKTMKKEKKLDEFLVNLYPETHDKFTAIVLSKNTLNFIGKGPRLQRYNLLNTSFKQKYNRDLLDYPDYFTEDLLKITPLKEREHILDHKVKENEKLYYLYGTASSVPEFKQRLQHSSKLTRQEYANAILETCFANEDKDALLEVLRYLTNRYRNDIGVLQVILDRCRDKHSVRHFSADHWECLLNALKTCQLRYHYWGTDNLYESYIAYLITNGKSIDNVIKDIVKTMAETQRSGYVFIHNKRFRKMYCDKIANYIDTFKDHDRYKYMAQQFLYIASQQYKLKKNELLEYNRFFDQLSVDDWTSEIVVRLAVKLNDEVIHRLFWSSNNVKSNEGVIWYARNRPDKLNENVDRVIKKCGEHKLGKFLHRLNRLIEENLREEIKAQALNVVNNENSEDMKVSIIALSVLSPETFLELVPSAFPPDDGKIDLEESTDKINAQRAFVNSLRYTQNSPKAFSLVLKFCIGDYLKFALPSLYSLSYNAKELSLKEYLDGLFDTAVSVRKHFLLLGRHLFPLNAFCNILHAWSEGEKNFSMRNILLRKTVEYLIENPLESLWSLFKANLQSLDPDDRGIYDYLLKFQDISLEYMPEYIELVYKAIAANPDSIVNEKKFELVNNIPSGLVRRLNFEFLKQLVSELACSKSASIFHWQCVFLLDEMKRLELFEENFAKLKTNRVALEQDVSARYQISNFVLYFVQSAIKFKSGGELIDRFISYWSSMFQPENFNTDFMLIQFTNLLFKSDFDAYQSGVHTNTLLYEYIHKYNASIIDLFCRRLRFFLSLTPFEKEENDMLKFVDGFFNNKLDEHIYIAVMYLLPKTLPTYENAYAKYMPVWEALQRHESPAVRFYFDFYLCDGEL